MIVRGYPTFCQRGETQPDAESDHACKESNCCRGRSLAGQEIHSNGNPDGDWKWRRETAGAQHLQEIRDIKQ
jgi:hypothetical protein